MSKERKPFAVGDRVKLVGPAMTLAGTHSHFYYGEEVVELNGVKNEELRFTHNEMSFFIHPRQVTHRLIPKPKPQKVERHELWKTYRLGHVAQYHSRKQSLPPDSITRQWHMVELKPDEVIVSRADLAKSWEIAYREDEVLFSSKTTVFHDFCERLGLGLAPARDSGGMANG